MHVTSTSAFFTNNEKPRLTISVQLVFMRPQNTHIWPAVPCYVNDVELLTKMQNEAGLNPLQDDAVPHLRYNVDDYSDEIDENDMQAAVVAAGRLRIALLALVNQIRDTMVSKYNIEVFRIGVDELDFTDGVRKLITQYKENRRNENSGAIADMLDVALDRSVASAERKKHEASPADNYRILQGHSPEDLAKKVNNAMVEGWVPQGGLIGVLEHDPGDGMSKPLFYQSIVRASTATFRNGQEPASMTPFLAIDDEAEQRRIGNIIDTVAKAAGLDLTSLTRGLTPYERFE